MTRVAAILLAAGLARRFGGDKLHAPYRGVPLIDHAAGTLRRLPVAVRFAVISDGPAPRGFTAVRNADPGAGQGRSLALGVAAARAAGAEAVLVTLGDMPDVTADHLRRLLDRCSGPDALAASFDGTRPMPPAVFGARWFDALEAARGDAGARALLSGAALVHAPAATLRDIDTPEDLAAG